MKNISMFLLISFYSLLYASVDINNASVKSLTNLKGIGKKRAHAIVKYRRRTCFEMKTDLMKVKGIGPKIFEKNKNEITVGPCNPSSDMISK